MYHRLQVLNKIEFVLSLPALAVNYYLVFYHQINLCW